MSELGDDARELIERALRDEPAVDAVELQRIRRRVLAAGAGASIFGSVGKALAVLGKASLGPALKAFGVGVAVTVLALGIPTVLSSEKSPASAQSRGAAVTTPRAPERALPLREERPSLREEAGEERPKESLPPTQLASPKAQPPRAALGTTRAESKAVEHASELVSPPPSQAEPSQSKVAPSAPPKPALGGGETYSTPSLGAPARQSSPLVQEITLLEKVQSELRAGHGRAALELLDRSAAPPGGQLQAERLAAEVFAACQVGNVERARVAARLFLSKHASSPASARVRSSCAGEQGENAR